MTLEQQAEEQQADREKKLKIRIQLRQDKQAASENEIPQTEFYRWDRIGVAISALVLTLAIVIGGGFYIFSPDITNIQNTSATNTSQTTAITTKNAITSKTSDNDSSLVASFSKSNTDRDMKSDTATNSVVANVTPQENLSLAAQANFPVTKTVITDTAITLTAITEKGAPLKNKTIKETFQTPSPFRQTKTEIFSNHIKRFVISQQVKDKEPVGSIDDISFGDNNIATIYAYSDAVDLKDETLYYRWTLNGKKIAVVKIGVWSDRWRSYSSKFIQPHMQGDWQVELQNAKGETLAMNQFSF